MDYMERYAEWCEKVPEESDIAQELKAIKGDKAEIEERFYKDLEFGTAGLRGVIGAGTNMMNIYTVSKATQGYANYLMKKCASPSVAIAYDSRHKSDLFARTAASVFAANGVTVYIYPRLMPTPALSFAVRYLKCDGGIIITASHNPAKYNGYKVYGADGCQITDTTAGEILAEIEKIDPLEDVVSTSFENAKETGAVKMISDDVKRAFLDAVSAQSVLDKAVPRDVSIVYTPLNGTGISCVPQCLEENGFTNITIPDEQKEPDGDFPTCPYPNPEIREALRVSIEYAERLGSDLVLATDPDCDRVGVAVRHNGKMELITGNQMGVLLLDFICGRRTENGTMPANPVTVKTIVTTPMVEDVANDYGVRVINVLTGFKYIGEQIKLLEEKGEDDRYVFGFEESYGYLSGGYVRDKDGVDASLLICEMFAWYKAQGKTLIDGLNGLYKKYGAYCESLKSFEFEGVSGFRAMQAAMDDLRTNTPDEVCGEKVVAVSDYEKSVTRYADGREEEIDLPKSNVILFKLEDGSTVVVRPSGTEPKLKIYFSAKGGTMADGKEKTGRLEAYFNEWISRYSK